MDHLDVMASYLPAAVVRQLAADQAPIAEARADQAPGAVLFADVSGFSALADRLARTGPSGAEQLSAILNETLGRLIELIAAAGGDVVKFAGDALLALWPADDPTLAARRAARCGATLQRAVSAPRGRSQAATGVGLTVRIGVGFGQVRMLHLGGLRGRWELLTVGDPVRAACTAAGLANPGEVVIAEAAWGLLEGSCTGQAVDAGCVRLLDPGAPVEAAAPERASPSPASTTGLRAYIPRAILGRLAAGHTGWLAELRPVTLLFVGLPDLDETTSLDRAQALMVAMQAALYRHEGSINKLSVDDKGVTLVAALGLPPLAHEDDPTLGVLAAIALGEALDGLGERRAIGAATGRVFCGVVGNDRRREYTMIGDVVNLAARLMQAAPGGILCDEATRNAASRRLAFEALPPILVKGKAAPVAVWRPRGQATPPAGQPTERLVGRTAELTLLTGELRAVLDGGRRAVVVEGDAGIGKTRLVAELLGQARRQGVRVLRGGGDGVERLTPFFAWRAVFAELRPAVVRALEGDPGLRRLAPLLAPVLPPELPDNETTAQLRGQARADNTRRLMLRLLRVAVGDRPAVLVLDDAHWLDSASWALAVAAAEQVPSMLLLVVGRPPGPEAEPAAESTSGAARERLLRAPGTRRLALTALSDGETETLVRQHLGVLTLPEPLAALVRAKAEGLPLFIEELTSALRDAGLVRVDAGVARVVAGAADLDGLSFPDTVQGVITSRIDRLPPTHELTLKVASVIGRAFAYSLLSEVHPMPGTRSALADDLAALERAGLTVRAADTPDLAYLFKHVLTQEVAYGLLLFSQRRGLHRAVAEWYERAHAGDLAAHYPLLAHHWGRAEVAPKAVTYLDLGGRQALDGGAYQEAVRLLEEAVALDGRREAAGQPPAAPLRAGRPDPAPLERARRQRLLGEAYLGLGDPGASGTHLRRALAELGRPLAATRARIAANLTRHVATQVAHRARPDRVVGHSSEARESLLESARTCAWLNQIYYYGNRPVAAFGTAVKGLNLAERAGPSPELARLHASVGLSAGLIPLHRLAEAYIGHALTVGEQVGDLPALAWALQLGGLYAIGVGQWDAVGSRLDRADELGRRLGDRRRVAETGGLASWVAWFRGDFTRAAAGFAELERDGRRRGDRQVRSWGRLGRISTALRTGDLDLAAGLLEQQPAPALRALLLRRRGEPEAAGRALATALPLVRARPTECYSFDLYAASAEVAVDLWEAAGGAGPAAQAAQACLGLRRYARVFPIGRPRARLCDGRRHWLAGRPAAARAAWRRSLAAAERLDMPYDQGLAHARLGRHATGAERAAHLARAAELFDGLGAALDLADVRRLDA